LRGRTKLYTLSGTGIIALGPWTTAYAQSDARTQQESAVMEATSRDGTRIAFWRSGSGPPLVLVHGTTADHTRWAGLLPELERHFTVHALDRRGRGGSGDAPDWAIEREFEDVAAVVEAIGEPVLLLGHSFGAICALEAALVSGVVQRLVLYEPPIPTGVPPYPPGVPERIQALVDARDPEAGLEVFFREVVLMPEGELASYRRLPTWTVRVELAPTIPREMVLDRTYTVRPERFAGLSVPTLLLLGGDSPPLFRRATDALEAALPDSRVVVLPGQRHVAMDTAPELFLAEVIGFLGSGGS
jgi:pimeloyl-ACP methyl ester carboxylesterase